MDLTTEDKIKLLIKANPKLSVQDACTLLGCEMPAKDFVDFMKDIMTDNKQKC